VASEVNSFVKLSRLVPRNICNPLFFLYLINKVNAFMYVTQKILYPDLNTSITRSVGETNMKCLPGFELVFTIPLYDWKERPSKSVLIATAAHTSPFLSLTSLLISSLGKIHLCQLLAVATVLVRRTPYRELKCL